MHGRTDLEVDLSRDETYRTFWKRLEAGIIDGLVFLPMDWLDWWVWDHLEDPVGLKAWFIVSSFSFVTYTILSHGFFGQTVGKRAAGVKVLNMTGSKLSMRQAVLRDSFFLIVILYGVLIELPNIEVGVNPFGAETETFSFSKFSFAQLLALYASFLWFILELGTMLLNKKRRALHDFIAGSVVVRIVTKRSVS